MQQNHTKQYSTEMKEHLIAFPHTYIWWAFKNSTIDKIQRNNLWGKPVMGVSHKGYLLVLYYSEFLRICMVSISSSEKPFGLRQHKKTLRLRNLISKFSRFVLVEFVYLSCARILCELRTTSHINCSATQWCRTYPNREKMSGLLQWFWKTPNFFRRFVQACHFLTKSL